MTPDDPPLVSLGACDGGPAFRLLADGEEVEECVCCGAIVPTDLADGPFKGFAAWCERKAR